jgi:hypothetical protein
MYVWIENASCSIFVRQFHVYEWLHRRYCTYGQVRDFSEVKCIYKYILNIQIKINQI